jgi:hypothetical protein
MGFAGAKNTSIKIHLQQHTPAWCKDRGGRLSRTQYYSMVNSPCSLLDMIEVSHTFSCSPGKKTMIHVKDKVAALR